MRNFLEEVREVLGSSLSARATPSADDSTSQDRVLERGWNESKEEQLEGLRHWYWDTCHDFRSNPRSSNDITREEEVEIENEVQALVPTIKMDMRNGYCSACINFPCIYEKSRSTNIHFIHLSSLRHLEAGGIAGCRLCCYILQSIKSHHAYRGVEKELKLLGKPTTILVQFSTDSFRFGFKHIDSSSPGCRYPYIHPENAKETFSLKYKFSSQQFQDPLDGISYWLKACTEDHHLCNTKHPNKFPTRLLFLDPLEASGIRDSAKTPMVRLIETSNIDGHVQYATLSHCWGKLEFVKLTTNTLESFKACVPWHLLTKTFQDAIYVTRRLGIQYLWIDSLCIIQDSVQDWEREAGMMASVYGGSYITLAASAAADGSVGMFNRDINSRVGVVFPSTLGDTLPCFISSMEILDEGIEDTILSYRAWAFQERLLSTRLLYFGDKEIFWECRTKNACETFPNMIPQDLIIRDPSLPRKPFRQIWPRIVEKYSKCHLTFESDKLVALAGIARIAQQESGDEYVAGLWRTDMERFLCWRATPDKGQRPQNGIYRAPTWSWASIDGSVFYDPLFDGSISELYSVIIDVSVSPSGPDTFGQLSGGVITFGCMGILSMSPDPYDETEALISEMNVYTYCHMDRRPHEFNCAKILPIFYTYGLQRYTGLIIEPTGSKHGEFKRVGLFKLFEIPHFLQSEENFRQELEELGSDTARKCCAGTRIDPESGKEQFIITII